MKKLLTIALAALSISFAAVAAEAKPAPQFNDQEYGRRHRDERFNHRVWTTTQTRVVRTRRGLFRETYLITHFPNGRTRSQLISRVRIYR